jgi:hypothetical protein
MFKHAAAKARRRPFVLVLPLTVALLGASAFAGLQLAAGGRADDGPGAVSPDAVTANTGVCKNVKQAFAVHTYAITQSTTFVDITSNTGPAAVTFTVSGTTNTCLIVYYTASAQSTGTAGYVRALLDGTKVGNPVQALVSYFSGWKSAAANFVLTGVPPGKHTLAMQFKSYGGQAVELDTGTLVVGFR